MSSSENRPRTIAVPLVLFVLTMVPAIGLLIVAFTIWLSNLLGSAIWACVVVGALFLLTATILYLVALRGAVKRMQERLETVYQTSRAIQTGFDWIQEKIDKFWP